MSTSDEKKAPPYTERLQKEHCICRQSSLPKLHYTLTATRSSSLHLNLLFVSASHCNYPQAIFLCIALYCIGIHCLYGNAFHCWYLQAIFLVMIGRLTLRTPKVVTRSLKLIIIIILIAIIVKIKQNFILTMKTSILQVLGRLEQFSSYISSQEVPIASKSFSNLLQAQ